MVYLVHTVEISLFTLVQFSLNCKSRSWLDIICLMAVNEYVYIPLIAFTLYLCNL